MKNLLTQNELCDFLKIDRATLFRYRKLGLPVELVVNGHPRFDVEKVIEWFNKKEEEKKRG